MKKILLYTPVFDKYYDIFPKVWESFEKLTVPGDCEIHMVAALDSQFILTPEMEKYITDHKIDLQRIDIDMTKYVQTNPIGWIHTSVDFTERSLYCLGRVREYCRQMAIDGGYDYFLSIDSDIVPPPDGLVKLLEADRDCIGGWTYNKKHGGIMVFPNTEKIQEGGIFEVWAIGIYFFLEKREEFEKFPFFVYSDKPNDTDDSMRNESIRKGGYKIFCHPGVQCDHLLKSGKPFDGTEYEKL